MPRACVIVNGVPASGKSTLARALSVELDLPCFSKDAVRDFLARAWPYVPPARDLAYLGNEALWSLLGASPPGGIVETWFGPTGAERVRQGLEWAGIPESNVVELWCDCSLSVAYDRFRSRRGPGGGPLPDQAPMHWEWWQGLGQPEPLRIGTTLRVRTDGAAAVDSLSVASHIFTLLTDQSES